MIEGLRLAVPPGRGGIRVDVFLREALPGVPSRSVRHALEAGDVRVEGTRARKGLRLSEGDTVSVARIAEAADWLPAPGEIPGARVLYDDGQVVVLDKPAGVHSEPQSPREPGTLAGFLRLLHPRAAALSPAPGLTLLTRLDGDTSGAVLAALTAEAFSFLLRERERGGIRKTYCCLVRGDLEGELTVAWSLETRGGGRVRARVGTREADPLRWTVAAPIRRSGSATLVRATIARGRRHQIRAHLAASGFPIVGDRLYGPPDGGGAAGRLMLHAAEVSLRHPADLRPLTVVSPLPEEFGVI